MKHNVYKAKDTIMLESCINHIFDPYYNLNLLVFAILYLLLTDWALAWAVVEHKVYKVESFISKVCNWDGWSW